MTLIAETTEVPATPIHGDPSTSHSWPFLAAASSGMAFKSRDGDWMMPTNGLLGIVDADPITPSPAGWSGLRDVSAASERR